MAEVPASDDESDGRTITDGYFEEEFYVDAETVGEFLVTLGEQFQDSDEITVTGEDWEIPFAFREPIELDIEFAGDGEAELEIEVELDEGHTDDDAPEIA
jgi:amphi-Trp domain-containing protein